MFGYNVARIALFSTMALVLGLTSSAWAAQPGKQAQPTQPTRAALAIWCGDPAEPPPTELHKAMAKGRLPVLSGGALEQAGQTLRAARKAFVELRCGEAIAALEETEKHLLEEVGSEESRGVLAQVEAVLLVCADRLSDPRRANKAADRLLMTGLTPPPDVALVLRRYRPSATFGPPPAPTKVETDPKGAQVIRNLLKVGASPTEVAGGSPEVDLLDVELPGYRKVHRPLGSGETLSLGLRPEDRLPVLVDTVVGRALFSEPQAEALAQLRGVAQGSRLLVFAPKQRGGGAVSGERLTARLYDPATRKWLGPAFEVEAGSPEKQAQALLAAVEGKGGSAKVVAQVQKPTPQGVTTGGFRLPFSRTKWYTWVIAGGVAALIAGLLVAERFGKDEVTIHASK